MPAKQQQRFSFTDEQRHFLLLIYNTNIQEFTRIEGTRTSFRPLLLHGGYNWSMKCWYLRCLKSTFHGYYVIIFLPRDVILPCFVPIDVCSIVWPLILYLIGWCLVNSATTYPVSYWLIVWSIVWPLILYLIGWCLVKSVTT